MIVKRWKESTIFRCHRISRYIDMFMKIHFWVKEFFWQEITILVQFLTEWISFYVTWCVFWLFLKRGFAIICVNCVTKVWRKKYFVATFWTKTKQTSLRKKWFWNGIYTRSPEDSLELPVTIVSPSVKNNYDVKHNSLHLSQNFILSFYVHLACAIPEEKRPLIFASSVYNLLVCHRTSILH